MAKGKTKKQNKKTKIEVGMIFNKLTVINKSDKDKYWICQCECGNVKEVRQDNLIRGLTKSCGCIKGQNHGMSDTRLYRIWNGVRHRCRNPKRKDYLDYGGRGIDICDEWYDDFMTFYLWAYDNNYDDSLTLERIDVNSDYCPENCTWITLQEQASNKTNNDFIEYDNEIITLKELSRRTNINYQTLFRRYSKGDRGQKLVRPIDKKKSTRGSFNGKEENE